MWKVGGTKIERTPARYIFLCLCTKIREKVIFWVKRSVPKKFHLENFLGLLPAESIRAQDSENVVGFGDRSPQPTTFSSSLRFEVIAAQSEVI